MLTECGKLNLVGPAARIQTPNPLTMENRPYYVFILVPPQITKRPNLCERSIAWAYPSGFARRILRGAPITSRIIYRMFNPAQVGGATKPTLLRLLTRGGTPRNDAPTSRRGPAVRRFIGDSPGGAIAVPVDVAPLVRFYAR